ncbi:MAG TPA: hypothetical protein VN310_13590 [Candidatus Dormibacteraeota bacterium]|nr:hypothetical protein [Candidatus Dormibacteraeota bacterium]
MSYAPTVGNVSAGQFVIVTFPAGAVIAHIGSRGPSEGVALEHKNDRELHVRSAPGFGAERVACYER